MYEEIQDLLNNYKDNPNNEEQDQKIKQILTSCLAYLYATDRENNELVEKVLGIEKIESTLLYEIEKIKNQTSDFLSSWIRHNY